MCEPSQRVAFKLDGKVGSAFCEKTAFTERSHQDRIKLMLKITNQIFNFEWKVANGALARLTDGETSNRTLNYKPNQPPFSFWWSESPSCDLRMDERLDAFGLITVFSEFAAASSCCTSRENLSSSKACSDWSDSSASGGSGPVLSVTLSQLHVASPCDEAFLLLLSAAAEVRKCEIRLNLAAQGENASGWADANQREQLADDSCQETETWSANIRADLPTPQTSCRGTHEKVKGHLALNSSCSPTFSEEHFLPVFILKSNMRWSQRKFLFHSFLSRWKTKAALTSSGSFQASVVSWRG